MSGNRSGSVVVALIVGALVLGFPTVACSKSDGTANPRGAGVASPSPSAPVASMTSGSSSSPEPRFIDSATAVFNPLIIVGPNPGDLTPPDDLVLHYYNQKPVTWRTLDGSHTLRIFFPVKGFGPPGSPEPFQNMKKVKGKKGDEWVFISHFSANVELSTAINTALKTAVDAGGKFTYTYDQELDDERADGRIIIQK